MLLPLSGVQQSPSLPVRRGHPAWSVRILRGTIFGSGYVGLVTGACLADAESHVLCVDVDAAKIARQNQG